MRRQPVTLLGTVAQGLPSPFPCSLYPSSSSPDNWSRGRGTGSLVHSIPYPHHYAHSRLPITLSLPSFFPSLLFHCPSSCGPFCFSCNTPRLATGILRYSLWIWSRVHRCFGHYSHFFVLTLIHTSILTLIRAAINVYFFLRLQQQFESFRRTFQNFSIPNYSSMTCCTTSVNISRL